jgi:hypothetical protein
MTSPKVSRVFASSVVRWASLGATASLLLALVPVKAPAATIIGVNFDAGSFELGPNDLAGVPGYQQTHFNNARSAQPDAALHDNTGAATGAMLSIPLGPGTGSIAPAGSGPDENLNTGDLNNTGDIVFTISSIPFPT